MTTGAPSAAARSAAEPSPSGGAPSSAPMAPSTIISSAPCAASAARALSACGVIAQASRFPDSRPQAA